MQWTSHFFEVVIVASCNEYLFLPKKKKKPDQLLIFKRPQLALKLQGLLQPATTAAAKHSNLSVVNQAIAAMYEHPALHDHVAGWAPMRSVQHNAEVHLSFKDTSAQHRQQ